MKKAYLIYFLGIQLIGVPFIFLTFALWDGMYDWRLLVMVAFIALGLRLMYIGGKAEEQAKKEHNNNSKKINNYGN